MPAYTDSTEATALYPVPHYIYDINHYNDHAEVNIYFFPMQHNVDTRETTLWQVATLEVNYSVTESIFIPDYSPGKNEYKTTEDISTTVIVENAGTDAVSNLTAVLTLKDSQDHTLNSVQESVVTVPAGGSIETMITITNGLSTGDYLTTLEIKDATNTTLAISSEYIKVTSEYIAAFAVPEESTTLDEIPFTVNISTGSRFRRMTACARL